MKKDGIILDCKHCLYTSSHARGSFDVAVPIIDSESGISGSASLRCRVSDEGHTVDLLEWRGFDQHDGRSGETLQKRVNSMLDFVAERRICGNCSICPPEIIRIVEDTGTCWIP